ncbi:MAG: ribosome-binding factor A [Patescibacteria group bacterium]
MPRDQLHRDERFVSALTAAAALFISRESNRRSLITVTRVELEDGGKKARIFVSVLPKEQTHAVTDFLSRQKEEFVAFLKTQARLHTIPRVTFLPDPEMGESVESEPQA